MPTTGPWLPHVITPHDLSLAKTSLGSLAKKFLGSNSSANVQLIAKTNGVPWNTPAIDKWVLSVGGKRLPSGYTSFTPGNQILLPWPPVHPGPGDADKTPSPVMASSVMGDMPWWAWASLGIGAIWLYKRRKKKKSGTSAKIVRF
jgi:hypothetical protein